MNEFQSKISVRKRTIVLASSSFHRTNRQCLSLKAAVVPKISGGLYARHGQFPFMAVVHRLLGSGRISQCGGTILSRRWVLTAGHCIVKYPLSRFHVVFGIIDKSDIGYDSNAGPGVSMITTQTFLHPQYSQTVNDIGLLYMPRDIPFSSEFVQLRTPSLARS